jgi:hypothetical protein
MNNLIYQGTRQTPSLNFDHQSGVMAISGRCIPESAHDFWHPVILWIEQYSGMPNKETVVRVNLEYVNTSSSKYFLDVFKMFERIHRRDGGNSVKVEWYCDEDDEDMAEVGEDFQSIIRVPFEIRYLDEVGPLPFFR